MTQSITVVRQFRVPRGRTNRGRLRKRTAEITTAARVPRIARLMALAIRSEQLIHDGVVMNQAELAQLGHVSRARLTQIFDLLCLAPDLQEQSLDLLLITQGGKELCERSLRPIVAEPNWQTQRLMWLQLTAVKESKSSSAP